MSRDLESAEAAEPSRPRAPSAEDWRSLIVISTHDVWLGLEAARVDSVSAVGSATPLPGAPSHIVGLVAVGERALPLVDLATLLAIDGDDAEIDPMFMRTVFVSADHLEAGLVCHRAHGLIEVTASSFEEPSVLQGDRLRPFLEAELEAGDRRIGVLDIAALLGAAAIS